MSTAMTTARIAAASRTYRTMGAQLAGATEHGCGWPHSTGKAVVAAIDILLSGMVSSGMAEGIRRHWIWPAGQILETTALEDHLQE